MQKKILTFLLLFGIPLGIGYIILPALTSNRPGAIRLKRPVIKKMYPNVKDGLESESTIEKNDTLWHQIPPFNLINQDGEAFSEKNMEGRIVVADFIFTTCPGICPKLTGQLNRIHDKFRHEKDLLLLSHTVDPQRDTPEKLKEYGKKYNADFDQWEFLTGQSDDLFELSKDGYFMYAAPATDPDAEEEFDHSGKLVLLDKERVIRGYYYGLDSAKVDQLMRDIEILRLEYPDKKKRQADLEYIKPKDQKK